LIRLVNATLAVSANEMHLL